MGIPEIEEPLSQRAARLSISTADRDGLLMRESLRKEMGDTLRRSLVVLFELIDSAKGSQPHTTTTKKPSKRRRSLAHQAVDKPGPTKKGPKLEQSESTAAKPAKVHKKKAKRLLPPTFKLVSNDHVGRFSVPLFRNLILHVFGSGSKTRDHSKWFDVTNPHNVSSVVVAIVPGLEESKYAPDGLAKGQFHPIKCSEMPQFNDAILSTAPGSKESLYSIYQAFISTRISKAEKKTLMARGEKHTVVIKDLLLTPAQLEEHRYPLELPANDDTWRETTAFEHEGLTIFALDCEMCLAGREEVITRVSLVNFQGEVVFDEFVRPDAEITDYKTKFLGITEELLEGVTTTLRDIQDKILATVSATDVLIGHSLEHDLSILRMKHSNVIDTAVIYDHDNGPPSKPSLRQLALKHLDRYIQTGEATGAGHSSVEDATACLDLVKLKLIKGKFYGKSLGEEPMFAHLAKVDPNFLGLSIAYQKYQPSDLWSIESHLSSVKVTNDDEVVETYVTNGTDKRFVVLNMRQLEFSRGWLKPPMAYLGPQLAEEAEEAATIARINKIYEQMPPQAMLIVCSTLKSPKSMLKLQQLQREWKRKVRDNVDLTAVPEGERWTPQTASDLYDAVAEARQAILFVALKPSQL